VRKSLLSNFVSSLILPVRKPLPNGLNGTNPIPVLQRRYHFRFGFSEPQRVFALERRDRLDCVGAAYRLHPASEKAEVLHLGLPESVLHRSRNVLNGHTRSTGC